MTILPAHLQFPGRESERNLQPETVQTELAQPSFWQAVREALRGSHRDFTTGNLNRAIVLLAIPMVLEMVLESLFAVVDIFWVGRLGPDAIATVGLTESMLTLIIAVGLGLGMATTAMVARRIGEKDPEGAAVGAMQGILLSLAISVVIAIPCTMFAPQLLRIAGGTPAIVAIGSGYTRIALGGGGVLLLLFLNNAIFRGAGDAAVAMRLLWVSNIINLALDPCLIFGLGPFPRLGVTGAAAATFTGRSIGVLYQFYRLARGTERMRIGVRQMRLNLSVMLRLIRVSSTGILQFVIAQASWIGLVRIVSALRRGGAGRLHGRDPDHHLHPAALVGAEQRRGDAGGAEPGRRATRSRGELGVADGLLEHDLPGLDGSGVLPVRAADCERVHATIRQWRTLRPIRCASSVAATSAYAFGMVMMQAFNGAGDTITPTIVNLFGFWILELPLAWLLAHKTPLKENGVFLSVVIAEMFMVAASVVLFRQGRWKRQKI